MAQADLQQLRARIAALVGPVAGPEADLEAGRILDRAQAQGADCEALALAWAGQRGKGAPLGLVLGSQPFLGVTLLARGEVLAPREETELLGREALAILRGLLAADPGRELRLIDVGCGSGNLTCALGVALPEARIWASDLTESCAALTRDNVALNGLQDRVQVTCGDLFGPLAGQGLEASMDVVVMNPPYIPSSSLQKTHAALLEHEPREAFDGGPYGISVVTRLIQEAPAFLKDGGHLLFEFGLGQARVIQPLVERRNQYRELRLACDAQGQPRVAVLRK